MPQHSKTPITKRAKTEKATFAAGCFWHVEAAFSHKKGVVNTTVGYTGGTTKGATYEDVCNGETGHAEAVQVEFDPTKVTYETLLDIFWRTHDPTTMNRQGPDIGDQYRSVIFYHNEAQRKVALASLRQAQKKFNNSIVTQIVPAAEFYRAEEYHQRYLEKTGQRTCSV